MARTSRYENKKTNLLNIGLYVRLSDEDGKDKESESIKNQKIFMIYTTPWLTPVRTRAKIKYEFVF